MLKPLHVVAVGVLLAGTLSAQLPPLSPAHLNPAIEKLASGKPIYGLLTQDLSRENARILGRRDTDFIFIDMEHSPFNMEALANFVAAMNDKAYTVKNGAQPRSAVIVRMPPYASENAGWVVKQALDIGVMGFVFNTVETKEEAEAAVQEHAVPAVEGVSQHAQGARGHPRLVAGRSGLGLGHRYGRVPPPRRCLAAQSGRRLDGDHDHRDRRRREERGRDRAGAGRDGAERRCRRRPVVVVRRARERA